MCPQQVSIPHSGLPPFRRGQQRGAAVRPEVSIPHSGLPPFRQGPSSNFGPCSTRFQSPTRDYRHSDYGLARPLTSTSPSFQSPTRDYRHSDPSSECSSPERPPCFNPPLGITAIQTAPVVAGALVRASFNPPLGITAIQTWRLTVRAHRSMARFNPPLGITAIQTPSQPRQADLPSVVSIPHSGLPPFRPTATGGYDGEHEGFNPPLGITAIQTAHIRRRR